MRLLTHELPNGQIATRSTNNFYYFVVIGEFPKTSWHYRNYGTTWTAFSWHSTRALAEKKVAELNKWPIEERPLNIKIEDVKF